MRNKAYPTSGSSRNPKRAVTIVGQGVFVRVRRGMLQVEDGFPLEHRRTRLLTRATERFERILFLAGSGVLTVDALDWCTENEIPLVGISQSGFLRWTLLPGKGGESVSRLRRGQRQAARRGVAREDESHPVRDVSRMRRARIDQRIDRWVSLERGR